MAVKRSSSRGRPRDPAIDDRILEVARRHLAREGYDAMTLTAVAEEAGTTRQAVYRRWPSKADLATAAIASLAERTHPEPTGDHFADLVAELESFRQGIQRPDGLSMVGTMLVDATDPELVNLFRRRLVVPRRRRIAGILERARGDGLLDVDADIELAVTTCTGSWYARALATDRPLTGWSWRLAELVWRGLGGTVPGRL
jgi:AcrR family transcriptional regulator